MEIDASHHCRRRRVRSVVCYGRRSGNRVGNRAPDAGCPRRRRQVSPTRAFCRSGANLTAQSAGGMHPHDRDVSIGASLTALSAGRRNPRCGFVGLVSLCRRFAVPQYGRAVCAAHFPHHPTACRRCAVTGCRNVAAAVVALAARVPSTHWIPGRPVIENRRSSPYLAHPPSPRRRVG